MNSRFSTLGILAVAFVLCSAVTVAQPPSSSFDVVLNRINDGGPSKIASRHIYVYCDESDFEIDRLIEVSKRLADEYPVPYILRISIYTSRQELVQLREFEDLPFFIEFAETPAGRKAAAEYDERVGPRSEGYFRAEYYRTTAFELIDHSPDKNSPRTERINLKSIAPRSSSHRTSIEDNEWLDYWPAVVELTGELNVDTFFGPPNFGEAPETDTKERHWILTLDKPINVRGRKDPDPGLAPSVENVSKMQLVLSKPVTELVGKKVKIKGTLFHAHTGHHHTDVLLEVETIVPAR